MAINKKDTPATGNGKVKQQPKSRYFNAQMQRVFAALYRQPKTMLMVEVETGIMRSNICWFIRTWRQKNSIQVIRKGICPVTKHRAGFYTTNPDLFPAIVEPSNTVKL